MKKESKITNEDIAEIIEKGFSESEKRTDKKRRCNKSACNKKHPD